MSIGVAICRHFGRAIKARARPINQKKFALTDREWSDVREVTEKPKAEAASLSVHIVADVHTWPSTLMAVNVVLK